MNSPITLLIVDDEQEIRSGLRSIIPWEQYSVSVIGTSPNGADALNKIRYYEPDIVITDIQMPGMNGLELVRRTKEEQFNCSFIILSGYDDFQYAKTAIRYGVSDYLLKPVSIRELTELIKKLTESIIAHRCQHTDQLSTLSRLRSAQISLRQNNLIPQLLRGEISSTELSDVIREFSLPICDQDSCVVLIQAFSSRQSEKDGEELNQSLLPLKKTLESYLPQSGVLISDLPSGGLLLLVNLPFTTSAGKTLAQFLLEATTPYNASEHLRFAAAIGSSVTSLLEISASYQAARQLISWHIYPEIGDILEPPLLEIQQPAIIMPDNEIWEAVLKNDTEAINQQFSSYLSKLLSSTMPPPSYIYSMCNYLVITIQNQISQYQGKPSQSFTGNTYAALQNLLSIEEIKTWMYEVLCNFASELSISRATKNDPLIEKAISYINQNLLKSLHTDDVCNYLGLSKSYFSTYFKNKTQLTFRDYTLNLKINYAQEQLKHPEHTPKEVALMLGYEDYRSFGRAFKARTGFSPSDYQSQYTASERNSL